MDKRSSHNSLTIVVRDNDSLSSSADRTFASAIAFAEDDDEHRSAQHYETHQSEVAPSNANIGEEQVSTASTRQAEQDQSSEEENAADGKEKTSHKDEAKASNRVKHAESYAPASMNKNTMIKSHESEQFRQEHGDGDSNDDDDHDKSKSNDDHQHEA